MSFLLFIKFQREKNFSKENYNSLVAGRSETMQLTQDPCLYKILGDPEVLGEEYIKINFWCSDGRVSKSTLAMRGLSDLTFLGVVSKYSKIVGIDQKVFEKYGWTCNLNSSQADPQKIVTPPSNIDCYENKSQVPRK